MTPAAALLESRPLLGHHPVGASTGYLDGPRTAPAAGGLPPHAADFVRTERTSSAGTGGHGRAQAGTGAGRGDWERLVELACDVSPFAAELAALSECELPSLVGHLAAEEWLPFHYVSVHAPAKGRRMPEDELVALLAALPCDVDAIVVHPDVMDDPERYRILGRRLVLENMDTRKPAGRTAAELAPFFARLPEAGLCLDIAHAADVDPTLAEAERLLDRYAGRLRHLHVSSLDASGHHVPLRAEDEAAFAGLLRRCRDVPWILEAPLAP